MSMFQRNSIRDKLMRISMLTAGLALILAVLLLITYNFITFRHSLVNDLTIKASMVSNNSVAAILFNNPKDAEETLSALRAAPNIVYATIFTNDGRMFARYQRDKTKDDILPKVPQKEGYYFGMNHLSLFQPIVVDNKTIGSIFIQSDLKLLYYRFSWGVFIAFIVIVSVFSIAFFLLSKLQQTITKPILSLVQLMQTVSKDRNYSVRTQVESQDEIGTLSKGFNDMLEQIQKRDKELELHQQQLKEKVKERTSELIRVNEQLVQELTERKRIENNLRESEEKYRTIFENTGTASIIIEEDTTISLVNSECEKLSGYSRDEAEGKMKWTEFIVKEDLERMKEYHQVRRVDPNAAPKNYEFRAIDKQGNIKNIFLTVALIPRTKKSIASLLDITEQRKLEEQLLQAQKMEAVGQLAGGIAHDFNNILQTIIGFGNLLQMKMREDDPLILYINQILRSAERAASLTQSLLAYSRKQMIFLRPITLNEIIKKMEKLLIRFIGEDIELRTSLTDKEITILADSTQIEQVLMNLATNAQDAMPDGGTLSITTDLIALNDEYLKEHIYGKPGIYALISVTDTGGGMNEKTKEKIFEPFFTTKEVGKGTGLGLAMVYGIIKQHEGFIDVYSEIRKGTTFKIYLPLAKSEIEETSPSTVTTPVGGTEIILLAEDDAEVREFSAVALEDFGYKVIKAVDGEDAINKFMDNKDKIQLLLLDVIMPKKNGKEVYEEVKKIKPAIKALFISGYTSDVIHKKGIPEKGSDFVLKPISPAELLKKIREVLDKE